MAATVKDLLRQRLPRPLHFLLWMLLELRPSRLRARRLGRRLRKIGAQVKAVSGGRVLHGPFTGMFYGSAGGWDLASKLLGSYEAELHDELDRLIDKGYDRVINVGCAEGYYAVGLSLRLPQAEVFAFDIDANAVHTCRLLGESNGVGRRLHVAGECSTEQLQALIRGRTLLIIDIEGAELSLVEPAAAPNLASSDMIVELHDMVDPSISTAIPARLSSTHSCRVINSTDRNPSRYEELRSMPWQDQVDALDERRPCVMQWAVLEAVPAASATGSPG